MGFARAVEDLGLDIEIVPTFLSAEVFEKRYVLDDRVDGDGWLAACNVGRRFAFPDL